jgi:chromosome segregation ATPase
MEQMPKNFPELLLAYKSLKNQFSNQLQVLQQQLNDSSKALTLSEQAYLDLKQQFVALEQVLKTLEVQSQALNQVSTDYTKQVQILTSQYNDLKVSTDNLMSFSKTQQTKLQFLETFTTYIGWGVVGILALQVVQIVLKFIP